MQGRVRAPYLAYHKRWVASMLVFVVAVGVNLIPDLTHPPEIAQSRLGDWVSRYLLPMAERKHDFGAWNCGIGGNQSVAGLWQRWLVYETAWEGTNLLGVPSSARVQPETLKIVAWGSMLLLLAAALVCGWKTPIGMNSARPSPSGLPPETGLQFGLMVLLSPHSSKPHFCTLLLGLQLGKMVRLPCRMSRALVHRVLASLASAAGCGIGRR